METILIVANIVLAIVLIIIVLLQRSEGGALGLGLSQDNFASTRSVGNFLTKTTAIIATLFIISTVFSMFRACYDFVSYCFHSFRYAFIPQLKSCR